MSSILIKSKKLPLFGNSTKDEFFNQLVELLKNRVIECYVFGSCATDTENKFSDLDLIIITNSTRPFTERYIDFLDVLSLTPRIDLLIYTPSEFEKMLTENNLGFWSSIKKNRKKLI